MCIHCTQSTHVGPQVQQEEVQTTAEAQAGVKVGKAGKTAKQVASSVPQVWYSTSITANYLIYVRAIARPLQQFQPRACCLGLNQPHSVVLLHCCYLLIDMRCLSNHKNSVLQVKVALMCASNAISQDIGQAIVLISHHHAAKHRTISSTCVEQRPRRFLRRSPTEVF